MTWDHNLCKNCTAFISIWEDYPNELKMPFIRDFENCKKSYLAYGDQIGCEKQPAKYEGSAQSLWDE